MELIVMKRKQAKRPYIFTLAAPAIRALSIVLIIAFKMTDVAQGAANTYYVAKNGSDSTPGICTFDHPCHTIAKGLSMLKAGDTLYIRAGTYTEKINSNVQTIPTGTSWSNPVTIAAYPGETVILQANGDVVNLAHNYIQYLIFDGIIFDANLGGSCPPTSGCGIAVVSLWGGVNHVRIQNCVLRNSIGQGITIFYGNGFSSDYNELLRCKIHDNGTSDFDHGIYLNTKNNLIDGNEFYRNAGWGIHKYPKGDNNVFRNNKLYNNARIGKRGPGIGLYGGTGNQVYNNLIWGNAFGVSVDYGESGAKIFNNTIYRNTYSCVNIGAGGSNTNIKNNICWQNGSVITNAGPGTIQANNLTSDPKFVNASAGNFHLQSGSPAIDSGLALAEVTADIDGVPRPQGPAYDIGAYEFKAASSNPPPAQPTGLRIKE